MLPLFTYDRFKDGFALLPGPCILRQKYHTDPIGPGFGKIDTGFCGNPMKKLVGYLRENSCSITGTWVTSLCSPMREIFVDLQGLFYNVM